MKVHLKEYSYRFAEQILNSKFSLMKELKTIVSSSCVDLSELSRPRFNKILEDKFVECGWKSQAAVFSSDVRAYARLDFLKDRVGVEVQFGHASFVGIDLLKFQISSYSNLDNIDLGVYICTTVGMQKYLSRNFNHKWNGSLNYEKVVNYLPHCKSAIQVPIFVMGIDI